MLDEIATQASQLKAQKSMKETELKKKERDVKKSKKEKSNQKILLSQKINQDNDLIIDNEFDNAEAVGKALVQDVIDEARENGNPLPPSVLRLLNFFKGNLIILYSINVVAAIQQLIIFYSSWFQ